MIELNKGFNMDDYGSFKQQVLDDLSKADRDKVAVAHWVQGEEARVVVGNNEVTIGADDSLNMMEMLLASLAACDAAMIGLHASFMGLKVNSIRAEFRGHFNVAAYLGVAAAPDPGYDRISAQIHIDAPDATPDQIAQLKHICEVGSPVGDSLARNVPIQLEIITNQ